MNFSESQTSKKENYNSYQKSVWRKTLTQSAFFFQNYYLEFYKKKVWHWFTWRHPLLKTSLTGSFLHEQLFWVKVQVPASKHPSKHLCGPTTSLQRDCSTVVFSWILRNFSECFTEHSVNGSFLVLIFVFFNENFTKAEFCHGYFLGILPTP